MNSDYEKRALIYTSNLKWEETSNKKVLKKILSLKDDEETSLIKIRKDGVLNESEKINSVEIFVLEGVYTNDLGSFPKGSYLKLPQENENEVSSKEGCVIFRKTNQSPKHNIAEKVIIDTNTSPWHQGQGNLTVKPLSDQTALVKWPEGEVFIPHKHWGGEEIYVLKGVFMDEYGEYPKDSWIRSPHLSIHHPFVKEETIIFVKTGHI